MQRGGVGCVVVLAAVSLAGAHGCLDACALAGVRCGPRLVLRCGAVSLDSPWMWPRCTWRGSGELWLCWDLLCAESHVRTLAAGGFAAASDGPCVLARLGCPLCNTAILTGQPDVRALPQTSAMQSSYLRKGSGVGSVDCPPVWPKYFYAQKRFLGAKPPKPPKSVEMGVPEAVAA